jgi:hypothetical protein
LVLTLVLRFGPDVPFLRFLRAVAVETPARWLSRLERRQIVLVVLLVAIVLAGGELYLIFFGPEFAALFASNLGLYLDAMVISAVLSVATVARRAIRIIRMQLVGRLASLDRTFRRGEREVRTRSVAKRLVADNEDEPTEPVVRSAA